MDSLYNQLKEICTNLKRDNLLQEAIVLNSYIKQYCYRYFFLGECFNEVTCNWEEIDNKTLFEIDSFVDVLFDGRYNKQNNGSLFNYHDAGRPRKLAVKWHIKRSEYSAYFWFEDEEIRAIFDRFYGAHPETKTDFMIRIDAEKNKYELALYRYGLKEPYVISESAYQLIVFKNKFECYRSENYNQPRGAWIW